MPLLPSTPTPLLLPSPDYVPSINDIYDDLMRRSLYDLVYFNGKLRPVEEIMMACCAAMGGYAPHTMLPAPAQPSSIEQRDHWARIETGILSPALQVTSDPNAGRGGFAVVTRRGVHEGHALLRVPSGLALTADGAVRAFPTLLSPALDSHVSLAVWLMRLVDAPPARLRTYMHTLRTGAEVDCTLRWSDEELAQLQTSYARSRANTLRR